MINIQTSKKVWIALIVLFFSGITIGAICGYMIKHYSYKKINKKPPLKVNMMTKRLDRELNFSPEQKKEAEIILKRMSKKLKNVRLKQRPVITKIIENAFIEINSHLDKEQQSKMLKFKRRKQMKNRNKRKHQNRWKKF